MLHFWPRHDFTFLNFLILVPQLATAEPVHHRTSSDCDRPCGFTMFPVCDNLGNQHSSQCAFDVAQCKNPSLEIAYQGSCETPATKTPEGKNAVVSSF